MSRRFINEFLDDPLFVEETSRTRYLKENYPQARTTSGELLLDEDTFYVEIRNKKQREVIDPLSENIDDLDLEISIENFTYKQERKILAIYLLINSIQKTLVFLKIGKRFSKLLPRE